MAKEQTFQSQYIKRIQIYKAHFEFLCLYPTLLQKRFKTVKIPFKIYLSAINAIISQYVLLPLGLIHPVPLKRTLQNKRNKNIRRKKRKKKKRISQKGGNITKRKKRREKRKSILPPLILLRSPKSN